MINACILAVQRYENLKDIDEWVNYHLNLGFEQIFILDNNDEDSPLDYVHENVIILPVNDIKVKIGDSVWQCNAYNRGFEYIKELKKYNWIAIIDIDEFISLNKHKTIQDFIQEECIDKNQDNIELKWQLYHDNGLIYSNESYHGNIQKTFVNYYPVNNMKYNDYDKFYNMKYFIKFIGKIKPELRYSNSPHYPDKFLYDCHIYNWNLCDYNIAVLKHYKYKTLEDFISGKCKYRNYNKSVHGSSWKYTRTYFEDNNIDLNKIFYFVQFDYKYQLNMEKWDIQYLHELLQRGYNTNHWIFNIWFGSNVYHPTINKCINSWEKYAKDFIPFTFNETNLDLNICPYTKFMYEHKLYGICADFFKCLLLYYFGGVYMDRDVELFQNLAPYYDKNDYMFFDASFFNLMKWFTGDHVISSSFMMSKPFNPLFKYFIDYCNSFTYEQLENMYNTMSKKDFMDYFYDVKIFHYHVIQKHGYKFNYLKDTYDEEIKHKPDGTIDIINNFFLENQKYNFIKDKPNVKHLLMHHNLKTHEKIYL